MLTLRRSFHAAAVARRPLLGDHHGPNVPTFVRLPPPRGPLPEEYELLWQDPVAPELAIDFDAPHVPFGKGVVMFASGLGFFGLVGALVYFVIDPPSHSPVAKRQLPYNNLEKELGGYKFTTRQ